MPDLQNLLHRLPAARLRDFGQDRILYGAERLGDERRADQPRWIARAERYQPPPPPLRHRQRQQEAHQIDDILEVIRKTDAAGGIGAHGRAVRLGQPDRTADAGVKLNIFRQRRRNHALADIGFDEHVRLTVFRHATGDRPHIQRRMRPGRLGQILDDAGNIVVAFDQEHVAAHERMTQGVRIARRERLIAVHRLLQITGDKPTNAIEQ